MSEDARLLLRAALAATAAAFVATAFDMPLVHGDMQAGGLPFPSGLAFALAVGVHQGLHGRRRAQQVVLPVAISLFFAEGLPLLMTPFAPVIRLVFFGVIVGSAVLLYEWAMPD